MSYGAALALVVAGSALAAAFAAIARRLVHVDLRRRHHEVGTAVFLQLGVVFAVLLAFVFSEVWSEYNTASDAINGECASLHGVAIIADALAPSQRAALLQADQAYIQAVLQKEWPLMERRQVSAEARQDFEKLWELAAASDAANPMASTARGALLSLIATAHEQRETRLFQMTLAAPPALWVVLILFTVVLVTFVALSGMEFMVSHVAFTAVFAGIIISLLVLIRLLDYPFEGALRLPSTDFTSTLSNVDLLVAGGG
jgi:Protein of unknown function (DUF4239)